MAQVMTNMQQLRTALSWLKKAGGRAYLQFYDEQLQISNGREYGWVLRVPTLQLNSAKAEDFRQQIRYFWKLFRLKIQFTWWGNYSPAATPL